MDPSSPNQVLTHAARAAKPASALVRVRPQAMDESMWVDYCRLSTYRHRFARAAPAPRAKRNDSKNRGRASPVKSIMDEWINGLSDYRIADFCPITLSALLIPPHYDTLLNMKIGRKSATCLLITY